MLIKNMIQNIGILGSKDDILLEQAKSENSLFWYRGTGYQNNEIWEQPHGWQLHARPSFMLKSKSGYGRKPVCSKNTFSKLEDVPKYNYLTLRKEEMSRSRKDDTPSEFLKEVELRGFFGGFLVS